MLILLIIMLIGSDKFSPNIWGLVAYYFLLLSVYIIAIAPRKRKYVTKYAHLLCLLMACLGAINKHSWYIV